MAGGWHIHYCDGISSYQRPGDGIIDLGIEDLEKAELKEKLPIRR